MTRSNAVLALALTVGVATTALAVPYASQVRDTGSNVWEFVLNEAADEVTVLRDGANPLALGTSAGRLTFDMTGFSTFEIQVSKSAAVGWAEFNGGANLFADFEQPAGLAVNSIPSSPYFGTVYVNNSRLLSTGTGRTMGEGIYALSADLTGVDLSTLAAVADPNDVSQAKQPGLTLDGTGRNSAWRMSLDASGNVILSDWSDAKGGVHYVNANLTSGGNLLSRGFDSDGNPTPDTSPSGPTGGVFSSESDEFGRIPLHGSMVSRPIVTGTVGVDLTLWGLDEDLDKDLSHPGDDGNSLWRWNVGSATEYTINPTKVINAGAIPQTTEAVPRDNFLDLNIGVIADAQFSAQSDKWYFTQPRDNGNEGCLIVLSADGGDGNSPTLEWSSLQFSIDNNLDGFTDSALAGSAGIQDIFREAWAVDLSDDGTKLYLMMSNQYSAADNTNPYVGPNSPNLPGHVLIIPLDENGLPNIEIDDNGTPGDTSDDTLANVESIDIGADGNLDRVNLDSDAAGNIYVTNNITERLQVFSPGGSFTAITGSDGTFSLEAFEPPTLLGDYNGDGSVNAADYTVWRDGGSPDDTQAGYDLWAAHFGETAGSGSGAAVPEPATVWLLLAIMGLLAGGRRIR